MSNGRFSVLKQGAEPGSQCGSHGVILFCFARKTPGTWVVLRRGKQDTKYPIMGVGDNPHAWGFCGEILGMIKSLEGVALMETNGVANKHLDATPICCLPFTLFFLSCSTALGTDDFPISVAFFTSQMIARSASANLTRSVTIRTSNCSSSMTGFTTRHNAPRFLSLDRA